MKLCIVAGEASGDHHAAGVLDALRAKGIEVEAYGLGGDELESRGMDVLTHVRELAIVGLFNVIRHIPWYRRVKRNLIAEIESRGADAVLFIDFPDFNLSVASGLQGRGIPLLYYVSPQVWAWRKGRARRISRLIDRMMVIFPFEVDLYEGRIPVTFVGHPIIDRLGSLIPDRPREFPNEKMKIALLPGSRGMEIEKLLPAMVSAIDLVVEKIEVEPVLIRASTITESLLERVVPGIGSKVRIVEDQGGRNLASCDLAIASSGTVTLESAVLGIPTVVVYKLPPVTFFLAKRLVDLELYSLANIVAGREVVPELMQEDATASKISSEVISIAEKQRYERMASDLFEVRGRLGDRGASERVAEIVIEETSR